MKGTKRMQVALLFIISLLAMFCMGVGLTYAYFTASLTTTEQTLTFGKLALNVSKTSESTNTKVISLTGTKLAQGDSIMVDGKIMLESESVNAFVRMKPVITMIPESGKVISNDAVKEFETLFENGFFALCKNGTTSVNDKWLEPTTADDFYYYANKITTADTLNFNGEIPVNTFNADWAGASVKVSLEVQAIQFSSSVDETALSNATTNQAKVDLIASVDGWSVFYDPSDYFDFSPTTVNGQSGYSVVIKSGVTGDVVFPDKYKGVDVLEIPESAIGNVYYRGISSITIPSGIVSICNRAFEYCDSITINYLGTKAQLSNALTIKNANEGRINVKCSDGEITIYKRYEDVS